MATENSTISSREPPNLSNFSFKNQPPAVNKWVVNVGHCKSMKVNVLIEGHYMHIPVSVQMYSRLQLGL